MDKINLPAISIGNSTELRSWVFPRICHPDLYC
jgi:hypothetical protein